MEPRILGIGGPFQGQTLSLPEGEVSIGREPTNQMSVFDGSLSRHHCALARSGSEVRIRDLGSRTGPGSTVFRSPTSACSMATRFLSVPPFLFFSRKTFPTRAVLTRWSFKTPPPSPA